jgi:predicted DNA binding CopG/RHH family protein
MGATKREKPSEKVKEYIQNIDGSQSAVKTSDTAKKKTELVMVRLEPDDYQSLKTIARSRGVSASTYLRILLKDSLKNRY